MQVRNKMTPFVFLGLVLSTCDASIPASGYGPKSQAFANSTHAVAVARRQTACTPTGTEYRCWGRGYTQVPNTVWINDTTHIVLIDNAITIIRLGAFDGLTLMTSLYVSRHRCDAHQCCLASAIFS